MRLYTVQEDSIKRANLFQVRTLIFVLMDNRVYPFVENVQFVCPYLLVRQESENILLASASDQKKK